MDKDLNPYFLSWKVFLIFEQMPKMRKTTNRSLMTRLNIKLNV